MVGAPVDDDAGIDSGSAYIFERDTSGIWSQVAKITASDAQEWDRFGGSVSISGDHAIVGAMYGGDAGIDFGSAYIFERDTISGTWSQVVKITASDAQERDRFGGSVSISGDHAIVGADGDDNAFELAGSAYIFERDNDSGTWSQVVKITASDAQERDFFGISVSISGDHAIVGTVGEFDFNADGYVSGFAYIYERELVSGIWSQVAKLTTSHVDKLDAFGSTVSISGDNAIVGAWADVRADGRSGSAYIFTRDTGSGTWSKAVNIAASVEDEKELFGNSVSVSGDQFIVGSPGSASAYIYDSITENDSLVTLSFESETSSTGGEADSSHPISVKLSISEGGVLSDAVSVDVMDSGTGTATPDVDYVAFTPRTLTFPAGSSDGDTRSVELEIIDDDIFEGEETFVLELANIQGRAVLGNSRNHHVIIVDDEPSVKLEFERNTDSVSENIGSLYPIFVKLTIERGDVLSEAVSVDIFENGTGTATPDEDYVASPTRTITFPAGSSDGETRPVELKILDDAMVEEDETVELELGNLQGPALLGSNPDHSATIIDDDSAHLSKIYWACDGKIHRADLDDDPDFDGLNEETLLTTDVFGDIVLAGDKMMWFNDSRKTVQRANVDGSGGEGLFTSEASLHLRAVDSSNGKLYWTTSNTLQRGNLDGSGIEDVFTFGEGFGDFYGFDDVALDIDDEKVYWIRAESRNRILVQKADFFGTHEEELFSGSFMFPWNLNIKVDTVRKKVYWAYTFEDEHDDFRDNSKIHSANLDGTQEMVLHSAAPDVDGFPSPGFLTGGIAVNKINGALYWPNNNYWLLHSIGDKNGSYSHTSNCMGRIVIGNTLPLFQFTSANSVTPDETGTNSHQLAIKLHLASGGLLPQDMRVELMDAGTGSASPGDDYAVIPTQTIIFPAGSTDGDVRSIDLNILPDNLEEGEETIHLVLGNIQAPGVVGPMSAHEVIIADDDQPVTVEFAAAASKTNDESQTSHTLLLTLSRPGGGSLEEIIAVDIVDLGTGTASADSDYTFISPKTVVFPAGFTIGDSLSLNVSILDDDEIEEDETLHLQLTNLQGPGILGDQTSHELTITDDDIVVVEGKIYWAAGDEIRRANLNGTQVESVLNTSNPRSIELDVTRGKMYWMTDEEGKVWRANLDGTEEEEIVLETPRILEFSSFALDTGQNKLYTVENLPDFYAVIKEWDLETSAIEDRYRVFTYGISDISFYPITSQVVWSDSETFPSSSVNPFAVDSMSGQLYFTDGYEIKRVDADGMNEETLISGLSINTNLEGIAVDAIRGKMYWVDSGTGKIQRADLDGTNIEDIVTELSSPFGIAVISQTSPNVEFASANSEVPEESGTRHEILVRLNMPRGDMLEEALTIDVLDEETGTAKAGIDYSTFPQTTLTFPPGSVDGTTASIELNILENRLIEGNETVTLKLTNPAERGKLGPHERHEVTIIDDDIPPDLVGNWRFEEGNGCTVHDTVGTVAGDLKGDCPDNAPEWTTGRVEGALFFDGKGDYVEIRDAGALNFGADQSFSITVWARDDEPTGNNTWGPIVQKGDSALMWRDGTRGYGISRSGATRNKFSFGISDGVNPRAVIISKPQADGFHFLALVVDRDSEPPQMRAYIDGHLIGARDITGIGSLEVDTPLRMGWSGYKYFRGIIDEVKVYNNALGMFAADDYKKIQQDEAVAIDVTANDTDTFGTLDSSSVSVVSGPVSGSILDIVDGVITYKPEPGLTGTDSFTYSVADDTGIVASVGKVTLSVSSTSGLLAYYPFETELNKTTSEMAGVLAEEHRDGLLSGDPEIVSTGDPIPGQAFEFDGIDDYIEVSKKANLDFGAQQSFSLTAWVRDDEPTGYNSWGPIVQKGHSTLMWRDGTRGYGISRSSATRNKFSFGISDGVNPLVVINSKPQTDGFHFLALVVDRDSATPEMRAYIDGELIGARDITGLGSLEVQTPLRMGWNGHKYFHGIIDEVKVYNRALGVFAVNDFSKIQQDEAVVIDVTANDTDTFGSLDSSSVSVMSEPASGSILDIVDGVVTYQPEPGFTGTDLFIYAVADNAGTIANVGEVTLSVSSTSGLLAYYPFATELNRTTPEMAGVLAEEHRDGMLSGDPLMTSTGEPALGNAFEFDGIGDYIAVSKKANVDFGAQQSFSLTVWALDDESSGKNTWGPIVQKGDSTLMWRNGTRGYGISRSSASQNKFSFGISDGVNPREVIISKPQADGFHFLALVVDRDSAPPEMRAYIDGELIGARDITGLGSLEVEAPLRIGWSGYKYFKGIIDEVKIYNRSLSLEEIAQSHLSAVNTGDLPATSTTVKNSISAPAIFHPDHPSADSYLSQTIYEDAEDESVDGWVVYGDGKVVNMQDSSGNRIISTETEAFEDPFRLGLEDQSDWNNTTEFTAHLAILMEEDVAIYFRVETSEGEKFLCYQTGNEPIDISDPVICFGLGIEPDGQWHTIYRDLDSDLESVLPDTRLISIKDFYVFGTTKLDNIMLLETKK